MVFRGKDGARSSPTEYKGDTIDNWQPMTGNHKNTTES